MKANSLYFIFLLAFTSLTSSSCALLSSALDYDNKKLKNYIQGSGFNRRDLSDIQRNLTRNSKMGGDIYRVKLYPYTKPLIEALVDDQAAALSLTKQKRQTLRKNLEDKYLKGKTCFQFAYQVTRIKKASQLQDWKVQIVDHNKLIINTEWIPESLTSIPTKSFEYIGSVREPLWIGKGVACTNRKVDLSKNFDIKLTVAFAPFPFDKETLLSWEYPVYEEINGEKVEVKTEGKNYKGYRAW